MSLYYEAAELLTAPTNAGGSLKNRIFSKTELKAPPAQIYALVIETCKWSSVLKEVIEYTGLLGLEHKLTPMIALLLVHDLLLAKKGIALPATHGLRTCIERHKARLQAELTKARIRRKMGSMEALKEHVESGGDNTSEAAEAPHPRWIRINTLRTVLEDQLKTTFAGFERVHDINEVRQRGVKRIYIDKHIPNLVAIPASFDLTKSDAYISGSLIFQDKASCFPAYLLDPVPSDGDIIDSCAAPGNKTTHAAALMLSHASEPNYSTQKLHAFEKNKLRAETLKKMVKLAGSDAHTHIHGGQDFLKVDPKSQAYQNVGALLLDPSCSGSGIIGRDDMPELHLPSNKPMPVTSTSTRFRGKPKKSANKAAAGTEAGSNKRKRSSPEAETEPQTLIDDDGAITAMASGSELQARLEALSAFQLALLLHAMTFPAARKITYSTCSVHFVENEHVVLRALESSVARSRGWRVLRREEQVKGLKEWDVRGSGRADPDEDGEEGEEVEEEVREACIRANKGDGRGTMGFFLAGLVRDGGVDLDLPMDEQTHTIAPKPFVNPTSAKAKRVAAKAAEEDVDVWSGFEEEETVQDTKPTKKSKTTQQPKPQSKPQPKPEPKPHPKSESKPQPKQKQKAEAAAPVKQEKKEKAAQRAGPHGVGRPNLLAGQAKKKRKTGK